MSSNYQERQFIEIQNLIKTYEGGRIRALNGVNLSVKQGEFVAIMGPSGCGKSTLMNMIGALDQPDQGKIIIGGEDLSKGTDPSHFRAQKVGFVFQLHNLIPTLTAIENVQIPMFETSLKVGAREEKARKLLALVGLKDRENSLPTKLSGGERQRVAVARALANDPEILIADEPTGNLDSHSAIQLLELLKKIHQESGNTMILVTHDPNVAAYADRIIRMLDGKIVS